MKKLFLLLSAGILFSACHENKKPEDKTIYKTMTVQPTNETLLSNYSARLTGREIVEIRPQVQGIITRICINEGDKVKKGQTLFIIDQAPYEAALKVAVANIKTAEAKLATARLNMDSKQDLEKEGVISDFTVKTTNNELQEAQAALALAKAQESNARTNLSYTVVKSPVNGVAGMIPYHVGALVSSNITEPLVKVTDNNQIYAYFSITENKAIDMLQQYGSMDDFIRQAPPVRLKMSNNKMYPEEGRIDAVSGIVDESTGSLTLRACFPNSSHLLHNGGTATIVWPTDLKNCIVIPQAATYELQNRIFTFKVVADTAQSQAIEVYRLNNGTEYVVEKGLKAGDVIVAEGAGLIKEGTHINTQKK